MLTLAIPTVRVTKSRVAEAFYVGKMGFRLTSTYRPREDLDDPCYLSMVRDGARLHVSSFPGDGVIGTAVSLITDNVDALFAEFQAKGVVIDLAPTNQTWGNREMYVRDPDRNCLRFMQSIE